MAALKKKGVSQDELAVVYASLILVDDDVPVTEDKINTILAAAGIKVESIWPALYSKAIASCNVRQIITSVSASAGGDGFAVSGPAATAPASEEVKEEVKPPLPVEDEETDSEEDMGLSLFD